MKISLVLATLLITTMSLAQKPRTSRPTPPPPPPPPTLSTPSYSSYQNEITAYVGLNSSAVNLGLTYAKMSGSTGWGGYFQIQTEKDKVVNQMITLGGLYKIDVVNTAQATVYAAPGFGLSLVKIQTTNALTGNTSTEDKTVLGPSLRIGAQYKTSPTFSVGVERMIATNWFEEKSAASHELTTLAMTFLY